jgi:hypothetical protein
MKVILIIMSGFFVMVVGTFAIKALYFPVHTANQELDTAYDAVSKTVNADNAIYNYEWFKQTLSDIEKVQNQYQNAVLTYSDFKDGLPSLRSEWTFEDKNEDSRLRSVVDGLYNHREELIANYNARAKMANRNIFQDSILPDYINALTFFVK